MVDVVLLPLLAVYGLVIGSFLNVVGLRVLKRESVVFPPSHCVSCNHRLKAIDLVPVFSYLFLRGRCRYCGTRISPVYPLGEAATAIGWVVAGLVLGPTTELIAALLLVSILVVISITDIREMLIPNAITFPAAAAALVLRIFIHPEPIWTYAVGAIAGSGALLLISWAGAVLFKKESMGGGDVKLYVFIGLILGFKLTLFSIFAASVFAIAFSALLHYEKTFKRKEPIAFGPYIAIGGYVSYLWGNVILDWYWSLLQI